MSGALRRVIAIRPQPGLKATIAAGAARGLPIAGFPLARIEGCGWTLPEIDRFDALLAGSANAFRHGGEKLAALRHLPVLAVGDATAAAAREAGFKVELSGTGGLQALLDGMAQSDRPHRNLLRLAGQAHVTLEPPPEIEITTRIVYRLQHTDITPELAGALEGGAVVLLHSAAAAQHFASEVDRLGIARGRIALAALAQRIVEKLGPGWREVRAASHPLESELLALAQDMCQ